MPRNRERKPPQWVVLVAGALALSVLLGAVYYLRSGNLEMPPSGAQGQNQAAAIEDLAVQPLAPIDDADIDSEEPDTATASPEGPQPTPAPTANPVENTSPAPAPGQNTVPDGWTVVNVYIDGWSLASLAQPIQAFDPTHNAQADISFQPLSPSRLSGALKTHPEIIEKYAARLISNDNKLQCTTTGCTANGKPLDMSTLAEPRRAAGLGQLYEGYSIDTGVYLARIAIPDDTEELIFSTTTSSLRIPGPGAPADTNGASDQAGATSNPPSQPDTARADSVALAGGYGIVFPLEPAWIDDGKGNFRWANYPYTRDVTALLGNSAGPLLTAGPGSTQDTLLLEKSDPTLLTYLTSPTTGCGLAGLCSPQPTRYTVDAIENTSTTACYKKPSDTPEGRVALLRQDLTITVTPTSPIYLPGIGSGDGTDKPIDVTTVELTSDPATFTQTTVYVIDDQGLVNYYTGRAIDDKSVFAFDTVLNSAFVSCGAQPEPPAN